MIFTLQFLFLLLANSQAHYQTTNGIVTFESNATLEKIIATSHELKGIIDPSNNNFRFSLQLNSFNGFNSGVQKNHYAENYVESEQYPVAIFSGRIIEDINFSNPGNYQVRAKGDFSLHGITINKIIHATVTVLNPSQVKIRAHFDLNLTEYNIKVPRLVHKKVAENISILVEGIMNKK